MVKNYLFLILLFTSGLQAKNWTSSIQLEQGDRVGVLDSVSGAMIMYKVPVAGILHVNDGDHPIKSSIFYIKENASDVTTYFFQGQMKAAVSVADIKTGLNHETVGRDASGTSLAGAAADAVVLAEVATAIGTVALEFFPATAMGVGLGVTAYYVYNGVTEWLTDARHYARGIEAFGEYVAKKWMYARAAVVFTATAQLLMELEDMTDEEIVEVVDALWVSDDINKIRELMTDPEPGDDKTKMIKKSFWVELPLRGSRR